METPEFQSELKIILAGLDNAGKTSMLVALQKMYKFEEDVHSLKPTVRISYYQRSFLNLQLNFWDFGGQKKYRELYFNRKMYFMDVNKFIYLIDIQDEERFNESLLYLGDILRTIDELNYDKTQEIFICFSKMDDNEHTFIKMPQYIQAMAALRKKIFEMFPEFKFRFFSTSIYNVYSIVKMMSEGLKSYIDGYSQMVESMEDFGINYGVKQLILFDQTGLIIADFIKDYEGYAREMIDKIINKHLEFYKQIENDDLDFMATRGVEGDLMDSCYQFLLASDEEENFFLKLMDSDKIHTEEMEGESDEKYYLSMLGEKDKVLKAEGEIMALIRGLRKTIGEIKKQHASEKNSQA